MLNYTLNFLPNRFLVFGCGGTGSRFIPLLAQFIKTLPYIINPEITIFDFDEVEEKNLLRQNFVASDVGKNKAEVLAQRYSRAYGVSILPVKEDITSPINSIYGSEWTKSISGKDVFIIMCVDSVTARKEIIKKLTNNVSFNNILFFDTGNENDFGQVTISGRYSPVDEIGGCFESYPDKSLVDVNLDTFPANPEYFLEMKAPEETRSCADLDQTMAINCLVANSLFGIIQNLLYSKPISFNRMNISLSHGCVPEYMTMKFIKETSLYYRLNSKTCMDHGFYELYSKSFRDFKKQHDEMIKMMGSTVASIETPQTLAA